MSKPSQSAVSTREKILVASATLFTEQGYAGTSTRDIAEVVGITQPGLYRHFPAKVDIYLALAQEILLPWLDIAKQAQELEQPPVRRLVWLMNEVCWSCVESPYEFAFLLTNATITDEKFKPPRITYGEVLKIMGTIVQDGIDQNQFRKVDVEIALHMCMSLTDLLIFPSAGSVADKISEILALTAHGLAQKQAIATDALAWVASTGRERV